MEAPVFLWRVAAILLTCETGYLCYIGPPGLGLYLSSVNSNPLDSPMNIYRNLKTGTLASLLILLLCLMQGCSSMDQLVVYVGTYTGGKSESQGIYRYRLDLRTGAMELEGATASESPSFLALHPDGGFLYAVNESSAEVSAFSIDPTTGDLTFLNKLPAGGSLPCHIVVDASGKNVLIATYGGGNISAFPIQKDGSLGEATAFVQHERSPTDERGPNAHSINLSADNRFAFVADLGLNKVFVYRFDAAKGTLVPHEEPSAPLKPGAGPRHFAFHPDGRYAYVINELDSTMTTFAYDPERGTLREVQTTTTLPAGVEKSWTAEVQVEPSGRFVYGSNRGHDSIAVFAMDPENGTLTLVEHEPTQGKFPRGFGIDPTGNFLLVGNQESNVIVIFRINQKTGELDATGQVLSVPKPVCVKFLAL